MTECKEKVLIKLMTQSARLSCPQRHFPVTAWEVHIGKLEVLQPHVIAALFKALLQDIGSFFGTWVELLVLCRIGKNQEHVSQEFINGRIPSPLDTTLHCRQIHRERYDVKVVRILQGKGKKIRKK